MSTFTQSAPFSYQYVAGLANRFQQDTTVISRTGIIVDGALHSVIIPAKILTTDGQKLFIRVRGTNSGNGGAKTLTTRWNGANDKTIALAAVVASVGYYIDVEIRRNNSTSISITVTGVQAIASGAAGANLQISGTFNDSLTANDLDVLDNTLAFFVSIPVGGDNVVMNSSHSIVI